MQSSRQKTRRWESCILHDHRVSVLSSESNHQIPAVEAKRGNVRLWETWRGTGFSDDSLHAFSRLMFMLLDPAAALCHRLYTQSHWDCWDVLRDAGQAMHQRTIFTFITYLSSKVITVCPSSGKYGLYICHVLITPGLVWFFCLLLCLCCLCSICKAFNV